MSIVPARRLCRRIRVLVSLVQEDGHARFTIRPLKGGFKYSRGRVTCREAWVISDPVFKHALAVLLAMNDDTTGAGTEGERAEGDDVELAWETTDTDVDYRCPGFDIRRDEVRFPDGTDAEYHYVDEPPAVVILPFTPEGEVVVIEEWRQAVGRVNRGLPAGGVEVEDVEAEDVAELDPVDNDSDLKAAAARELAEETGYEAGSFEHLISVEPTNGIANSVHHHFLALDCEPTAAQDLDHNESIRVGTSAYADLRDAVLAGDIRDGRTAIAVQQYELTRDGEAVPDGSNRANR